MLLVSTDCDTLSEFIMSLQLLFIHIERSGMLFNVLTFLLLLPGGEHLLTQA